MRSKIFELPQGYSARISKRIITDLIKVLTAAWRSAARNSTTSRWRKPPLEQGRHHLYRPTLDSYQIRTLILTMLWRLVPTLIREGLRLYRRIL